MKTAAPAEPQINHVVQSGPLKEVAVRLRNAIDRSRDSARHADEVRLLMSNNIGLW
ncbi:OprD family outer membrane porin [Pseudomonas iridis]|uniref:OprD family outer membrane porin n=1 Tax=Pseudomonas iridis TaxID=2710587 RepID=UPI001E4397FB|nr:MULTISPECIES: OprD family outer membrane porin [Pseudomonas]